MTILILGKGGQVGRALVARLPGAIALGRTEADLEAPQALIARIVALRPTLIINAAAYTAVDAAEDDRDRAVAVNATAVGAIGEAARKVGARVIHYSTDCVFSGRQASAYREADSTDPISVYGASKLSGEAALEQSGAQSLILRVSWVYTESGRNFPLTILRLARERETLDVVADETGAPTAAALIADITARAVEARAGGLYHLAAAGAVSRHALAQFIVAEALAAGALLRLTPERIRPILAQDFPAKARRPANSCLDTTRLRTELGVDLPAWQDGIRQLIRTLQAEGRL